MKLKDFEQNLFNQLQEYDEICFGPNCGELGWEIMIISPIIKLFKNIYPNKKVYVSTREDRKELYTNSNLDDILTFNIDGDYESVTPRTNTLKRTPQNKAGRPIELDVEKTFATIKANIVKKYPNVTFFKFDNLPFTSSPPYDFECYDYKLNPDPINKSIIDEIVSKNEDKKIITIFSRHRIDLDHRNWEEDKWIELFNLLNKDKYLIFLSGKSPSYIKAPKNLKNIYNLEDLIDPNNESSLLGLTIEAIRKSKFTFGPQTAGILLSNILRVPTIYFGKEENLVSDRYNPYKNKHYFINVKYSDKFEYLIDVDTIYRSIQYFNNNMHLRNFFEIDPPKDTVEHICEFPNFNPDLIGLEGAALKNKLREINSNPNYRIPIIETTIYRKKIDIIE